MDVEQQEEPVCIEENDNVVPWAYLPDVVTNKIFGMLNEKDRKIASRVCKNWRNNYFRSRWWPKMKFPIKVDNIKKIQFLTRTFGKSVETAEIEIYSYSDPCVQEFIDLLEQLSSDNNLKFLQITIQTDERSVLPDETAKKVEKLISDCLSRLTTFYIKGIRHLSISVACLLEKLNPEVKHLRLASFSLSHVIYHDKLLEPSLLQRFTKLEALTVDYAEVTEELLSVLVTAKELKNFMVYIQGKEQSWPGEDLQMWDRFKRQHRHCMVVCIFNMIHCPLEYLERFTFCDVAIGLESGEFLVIRD